MARVGIEREGISFEFSGDTAKFDDSINGINRSLNILKKEFTLFKKELTLDPGNVTLLAQEMKNLSQQAQLAQHALDLYDRSRRALKDEKGNWITEHGTIQEIEKAQAAWERYTKGMEDAQMTLLKYNERMTDVQKQISEVTTGLFAQKKALEDSRGSFEHYSREMENNLSSLDKEFKDLKDDLKEQPDNVELLTKALHNLNEQSLTAAKYLGMMKERLQDMTKDGKVIEGYEKEYDDLSKKIANTEHSLETFGRRHDEIRQKIDLVTSELYKQNKALEESAKQWELFGNASKDIGTSIESVGRGLRVVSGAAAAAFGGAIKSAVDFESALTGVYKTVDETPTTKYEDIEKWIRRLATELPSTASEIASVAEMAGQLGITADSLEPFVKTMIDLGNATNLTATEGAKTIARFFNIMGHDAEWVTNNVEKFGSAITALGNNSATTEEEIAYMATNLAAAANTVGLTDQEVLGLATTLSSLGLSAERGGSAMSTIMRKIETDVGTVSKKSSERLAAWGELIGMTGEQFRQAWGADTVGTLHKIVQAMNQTTDAGESIYSVLSDVNISNIRQIDTITRLANGYDKFDEYMEMANVEWEKNSALVTEANRRYGTAESQIKMLVNSITEIGITLGETLLPIINDLVKQAKPYIDTMIDMAEAHGEAILKTLGLVAALSPFLTGLGRAGKAVGSVALAVSKYQKMATESTGATRSIALALANTGKYGLYGAAILAVAGLTALTAYMLYTNRETVKYKKSLDQLDESLQRNIETSRQDYLVEQQRIDGAGYYIKKLEELRQAHASLNDPESEGVGIRQEMVKTIDRLNAQLGSEVYQIDATTGAISRNGEEVQSLTEDYKALAEAMKQQAWIDANKGAYEESIKNQYEYMNQLQEAAGRYSERMANIDYHGIQAGEDFVKAAYQYLNGEITDINVLADILRNNSEFMSMVDITGSDALSATRTLLSEMTGYQRDYQTEIGYTSEKLQESLQFQEMYNAVLAAEPGQLDAVLAKYNQFGTALGDDVTQLTMLKDAMVLARDTLAQQGLDTTMYDEAIASIDEQINRSNTATETRIENEGKVADASATETDRATAYTEESSVQASNTVLENFKKSFNETRGYGEDAAGAVRDFWNQLAFDPKTVDLVVRLSGDGAAYLSSGGVSRYSSGFSGGTRSGGFASGGYNITFSPTFNVSGGLSGANAKRFASMMVDYMNEELGKRLRTNG